MRLPIELSELRRHLVPVERNRILRMFLWLDVRESIDEIAGAAGELARKHHGMPVVIVRSTQLRVMVEAGFPPQAGVSKPSIVSIFNSSRTNPFDTALIQMTP